MIRSASITTEPSIHPLSVNLKEVYSYSMYDDGSETITKCILGVGPLGIHLSPLPILLSRILVSTPEAEPIKPIA